MRQRYPDSKLKDLKPTKAWAAVSYDTPPEIWRGRLVSRKPPIESAAHPRDGHAYHSQEAKEAWLSKTHNILEQVTWAKRPNAGSRLRRSMAGCI